MTSPQGDAWMKQKEKETSVLSDFFDFFKKK